MGRLRLEKPYRDHGHDIDNTNNPCEQGPGFAVDLDKEGGSIGRASRGSRRRRFPPV